ncbi:MAG: 3-deoxy-8-phosphooctulonate synthase, partial [Chlorobiaceae bacterium]|nr:3-deoxy-8-phosphooctulonate synthase [Chlorobiaceae bacterium]
MQKFSLGPLFVPDENVPLLIAGPCVIENRAMAFEIAGELERIGREEGVRFVFKGSYRKANRSSGSSFKGIGDSEALEVLAAIREAHGMPVTTDVHETKEVALAARYVDLLQIPAFLCRQTDLLTAAG